MALAGTVLLALLGIAWTRIARVASLIGQGDGYHRVSALLVRRFGVPQDHVVPGARLADLREWGVERDDFLDSLRDELRVSLTEEEGARIDTVGDAARAAEPKRH